MCARAKRIVQASVLALLSAATICAQRQVAITFDDLPRGGDDGQTSLTENRAMTIKLLTPFHDGSIPFTGFVNECRRPEGLLELLKLWVAAGAELGNHTCSHPDLNSVSEKAFEDDVTKGETVTTEALGRPPRFFRYPFLHTGKTARTKDAVSAWIKQRGYIMAPVTLDNEDYIFARVYAASLAEGNTEQAARVVSAYVTYMDYIFGFFEQQATRVTGRDIKQILLVHANRLNADSMPKLLLMIRRRGYEIIPLGEALTDEAYQLPDEFVSTNGISWIHRWAVSKGMQPVYEQDAPAWIMTAYKKYGGN